MFSKAKKKANGSDGSALAPATSGGGLSAGVNGGGGGTIRRQPSGVPSIISADLTIEGNLISHGDLQIDGTVHGDIRSRTLTLGEHAHVAGAVEAETARICGEVTGEIRAKTVVLTKTAKVTGDVLHESLAIEAGAFIDGHCRRGSPEPVVPEVAKPTDSPAASASLSGLRSSEALGGQDVKAAQ